MVAVLCLLQFLSLFVLGAPNQLVVTESERSMDIERYSDQPLQLVDLKIGGQELTSKITTKSIHGDVQTDNITFTQDDNWFRTLLITFRNVSDRTLYGTTAYVHFKLPESRMRYSLTFLTRTPQSKGFVDPGGEVAFYVSHRSWNLTAKMLAEAGVDPNLASATFFVDQVRFSDTLMWQRGQMLRRDADNPYKWSFISDRR